MDGMGVNGSDVTSMLLLPELMYRHAFGSTYFMQPREWGFSPTECPIPPSRVDSWEALIAAQFPPVADRRLRRFAGRLLAQRIKSRVRSVFTSSDAEGHP
jgi:hypothetical protein